jgi:predicted MPP superfamily phosphohydrolase
MKSQPTLLLATLAFALAIAAPAIAPAAPSAIVAENFEDGHPPPAAKPYNTTLATDTTRARTGAASLRVTPKKGYATVFFDLDDGLDFSKDCEFSLWVYTEKAGGVSAYISADDGSKDRYTVTNALGTVEAGKWSELRGIARAADWRKWDTAFRLVINLSAPCWVDDILIANTGPAILPSQTWPKLETALHAAAGKRATTLAPGATVTLDATRAALAPDTAGTECNLIGYTPSGAAAPPIENRESKIENPLPIPAEGLLVFAIDAAADLDLTGILELHHTFPASTTAGAAAPDSSFVIRNSSLGGEAAPDLRPGLRATVLAGNTVIAAPAVKAKAWRGTRDGTRPGPAPDIRGERPSATIPLAPFRLAKGRHYLTIAGPHFRPAGTFARLELRAKDRPAEKPLHTFGFFSDTHLGFGRSNWMNFKLNARSGEALESSLRQLKREGAGFAILAGDMTDNGKTSQYKDLAAVIKRAGLPIYGCIGNHDTFADSRADIAKIIPKLFPSGPENTDYAFTPKNLPLRFIILDGSHWRGKDGKILDWQNKSEGAADTTYRAGMHDWLRKTLAADTATPTLVISHYPFYLQRGVSPVSGYDLGKPSLDKKTVTLLDAAPNIIATLNGHLHCNEVATRNGITFLQNPAFVEWPNAYRVFRVYKDRLEWEVRQFPNRGLIRESVIPEKALLYTLSTTGADLAGAIPLAPRKPVETIIDENFENAPQGADAYRLTHAPDPARAHAGRASLRVTPTAEWGSLNFDLDPRMDYNAGCEFSAWIYAEPGTRVTSYISAQIPGAKDRHTIANAAGAIEPGKWCRLSGKIPATKWRMDEREVRFVIRAYGPCWIDDATLRAVK